ncbi:MAG TPA: MFS transporter [Devosia sp.]|nr:MFS transporter [Devosia sp.]
MTTASRVERFTPELRASLFHFTVFGSTGAGSAYLAIWMSGKGLSSEQIGVVNALPVLLMLGVNLLVGRLADKASDWRVAIIILALISGAASLGFFLVSEFWGLLLVYTLASLPSGALVPVIDAATLRMAERRGSDFGSIRAWGTVGYTLASALTGFAIGWLGAAVFVPIFVGLSLLRAVMSLPLPQFRAPPRVDLPEAPRAKLASFMRPWFLLPCIAFALIQATHFFVGAMGALVWKIDGIGDGWVGPLIAVSAAGEATMMFLWRRVGTHMSARTMLIISGLVCTGRWALMALNPPLALLFALQAVHAITYPFSYFGIMHFVANWVPEEIAAEAQGFSSALTQGACVMTLLLFGWLVGFIGGQAYFVAAGMSLLGASAAWGSMLLMPAHRRGDDPARA